MSYLVEISKISKEYHIGATKLKVLNDIDFCLNKGEFVAFMGASGSGKSTLLHILGCLERPTSGAYYLNGRDVINTSDKDLSYIRANSIGIIFQTFNLLPHLNIYENVELPFLYRSFDDSEIAEKVIQSIEQVGLKNRLRHKPTELSGGEMQRVAIARAICMNPFLILADEPTGNLDSQTGLEILSIFKRLHNDGATIIMVTHDHQVASFAQKTITLKDGKFID